MALKTTLVAIAALSCTLGSSHAAEELWRQDGRVQGAVEAAQQVRTHVFLIGDSVFTLKSISTDSTLTYEFVVAPNQTISGHFTGLDIAGFDAFLMEATDAILSVRDAKAYLTAQEQIFDGFEGPLAGTLAPLGSSEATAIDVTAAEGKPAERISEADEDLALIAESMTRIAFQKAHGTVMEPITVTHIDEGTIE